MSSPASYLNDTCLYVGIHESKVDVGTNVSGRGPPSSAAGRLHRAAQEEELCLARRTLAMNELIEPIDEGESLPSPGLVLEVGLAWLGMILIDPIRNGRDVAKPYGVPPHV